MRVTVVLKSKHQISLGKASQGLERRRTYVNEHDALDRPSHAALLILSLETLDPSSDAGILLWLGLLLPNRRP